MYMKITEVARINTLLMYSPMQARLEWSANYGEDDSFGYNHFLEGYWWNMCEETGKKAEYMSEHFLWYVNWRGTVYSTRDNYLEAGRILLEAAGMDEDETFDVVQVRVQIEDDGRFHKGERTALLIGTSYCVPVTPQEAAYINGK